MLSSAALEGASGRAGKERTGTWTAGQLPQLSWVIISSFHVWLAFRLDRKFPYWTPEGQNWPVLCCDTGVLVPFVAGPGRNAGLKGHFCWSIPQSWQTHGRCYNSFSNSCVSWRGNISFPSWETKGLWAVPATYRNQALLITPGLHKPVWTEEG